jgi:hypothetical protein
MPIIVSTKSSTTSATQQGIVTTNIRFRVKGEKILLRWKLARALGWLLHFIEDPTGNDLHVAAQEIAYFVIISPAEVEAQKKQAEDAQAAANARPDKRILETPGMVIPRKRPN